MILYRIAKKNSVTYDISKCYGSILKESLYDIPLFTIHDKIESYDKGPIVCGEYFLDGATMPFETYNGNKVTLPNAFYSYALVAKLLEYGYIGVENVTHQLIAKRKLKKDTFEDFVTLCYTEFGPKIGKELVNRFIGDHGSQSIKSHTGFLTNSFDSVIAAWLQDLTATCTVEEIDNASDKLYIFKRHWETTKLESNTSIWRHVISMGILKLIDACRELKYEKLAALSTDSVTLYNNKSERPIKGAEPFKIEDMGQLFQEEKVHVPVGVYNMNSESLKLKETKVGLGHIYYGIPGSGKTQKLLEIAKPEDIVFCFTNKAAANIRKRSNDNLSVYTFDSYFNGEKGNKKHIDMLKGKRVFVDEYSMVPHHWVTLLYKAFCKFEIEIYLFGDPNQCDAVDIQVFDYLESPAVRQMCPNVTELKYIENSSMRYDKETHLLLVNLLETGSIRNHTLKGLTDTYVNICYFNKTKDRINKQCATRFVSEHTGNPVFDVKFKSSSEKVIVCKGMPVICETNIKCKNMFNSQIFSIEDISSDCVHINGHEFTFKEFSSHFNLAFCTTVYKYQGGTISEPYCIYDAKFMDKKQLYTAISRTTKYSYLHIGPTASKYSVKKSEHPVMSPYKSEYHSGKIYYIYFMRDGVQQLYIGCTVQSLDMRLKEHQKDPKSCICGCESTIHLLCNAPCKNKAELEMIEAMFINKNPTCVNVRSKIKEKEPIRFRYKITDVESKVAELKQTKFNISDNGTRLRIKYRDTTGRDRYVDKNYKKRGRDVVFKEMEAIQNELVMNYLGIK